VWSSDLLEGWTQFYQILIDRSDAYGATKALRGAKTTASLLIAEHIFARAFQLYVMQALNPDNADQRVADIAAKAQAHGNPHVDTSAVKKMMFDIEHHFYMVRRRYLMIDLFPEIIGRFTLGFADMIAMTNPFA
jgi:hypothetical protein